MKALKLKEFQLEEFSKYWFDISKLTVASLILKFFEPGSSTISSTSISVVLIGLTMAIFFVTLGLLFGRGIKR